MEILYSKDLKKELKLSQTAYTNLVKSGKLQFFKIGGRHATTREFLNDYINNQIMEVENERNK